MYFDGRGGLMIVAARQSGRDFDCRAGCWPSDTGLFDRFLASIAVDVHFKDRRVMDKAVDGREGHGGDPDQRRIPPLSMDWCPKCGLSLGAMGCLAKSFRSWG